jgi:hypothetical protein
MRPADPRRASNRSPGSTLGDRATRQSAEGGNAAPFDVRLAHEFYAPLIGPVEAVTKDTRHVLVVPPAAPPFQLSVTEKPAMAIPQLKDIGSYRDAAVNGADRA